MEIPSDSVYKCDCGRPHCWAFDPSGEVHEYGRSFSREEIEEAVEELPKRLKILRKLLKEPTKEKVI